MADFVVGAKLQFDGSEGIKSMKDLKGAIKDAQLDLINMQEKFGETSKEAINAARRVNELKDKIKDAAEVTDLFDPGKKFQAATNAVNGLVGGFTALTGAMGLLGVESDNVQKQLLKVQSALALTQGLSTIADSAKDFKRLGDTLLNTFGKGGLIGIAIAGVGALALSMSNLFKKNKELEAANKAYTDSALAARVEVNKLKLAFDQAKAGVISKEAALEQYNKGMGQTVGQAKSLNEAEKLMADNAQKYIEVQGLKAKANYILEESAKLAAEAEMARLAVESSNIDSRLRRQLLGNIEDTEAMAKRLESLLGNINAQIASASTGFKTTGPAATGGSIAKTPGGKAAEAEKKEELSVLDLFDKALKEYRDKRDQEEFERLQRVKDGRLNLQKQEGEQTVQLARVFGQQVTADEEQQAKERQRIADEEARAKIMTMQFVANQTAIFSDIIGRETIAGKALAVASATINTYLAATQALKADYSVYGPAAQFVRIATVVSTIALGLKQVREIVKTQVPGKGGGGSAPSAPSLSVGTQPPLQVGANTTLLNQNQLNQIGNAAVRAFVVESDVTNNQERIRRLNRAARLG